MDLYKTHIELFGEKEDLEKFRDGYGIKWELWYEPYRNHGTLPLTAVWPYI